jgi:hypothetical protein
MWSSKIVFRLLVVGLLATLISGCAAVHTSIAKRNLDVQTRVSSAIFVDPVSRDKRTVYVDIRSAVMEFDRRAFRQFVVEEFNYNDKGFRVIDNPDEAQFHMSVYVTKLEKTSPTAAEEALRRGGGGDVVGGMILGAHIASDSRGRGSVGGAIIGAIGVTAANALVQDVLFYLVADVSIKERSPQGVIVRKDSKLSTKQGDSGSTTQRASEATDLKEYRTRIVTTANKANLEIEEAQPLMFKKTAFAISSFF